MKAVVSLCTGLVLIAAACGGTAESGGTPGDAVTEMFAALQDGDGDLAVSYMSSSALVEMDQQLLILKDDPEASSAQLALMGIQINAEDIPNMTAADFASEMISSPMISSIMESAMVTIGSVEIEGNSAMVEVTVDVMGESETNTIEVVMEDGVWKVTEFGVNM